MVAFNTPYLYNKHAIAPVIIYIQVDSFTSFDNIRKKTLNDIFLTSS
jgi:hypothetical protein